jgi:transposase-like protein
VLFLEKYNRWHCREKHEAPQFTLKTGTVMEDSPIGLDKWLIAMWMVVNCKNGVSSYEIHRTIGVTQKTAWFLDHRIRLMLGDEYATGKLGGEVEADETFIGGKARNMHKSVHERKISGMGQSFRDKTIVMGLLERGGKVRTQLIPDRQKHTLQPIVREHVEPGTALYTDEMGGYKGLNEDYLHQIIDHAVEYVNGRIHTNGLENFWSLLKRGINGTYVSIEPFHLFRYLDEQSFRFNNRKLSDAQRFDLATKGMVGKRLTFAELTGKTGDVTA